MDSLRAAQIHNALATLCKKMDKELLYKYINGQTSEQEEKTIVDWLDANPNNQKELNALWSMQDALIANVPYPHHPHLHLPTRRLKWYRQRFIRICTQAAAVLLLVAGSWYASRTVIIEDTAKQYPVRCRTGRTTYRHYTPGRNQRLPEQRGKTGISDTVQ